MSPVEIQLTTSRYTQPCNCDKRKEGPQRVTGVAGESNAGVWRPDLPG